MGALTHHRTVPAEAEPAEVVEDRGLGTGPVAGGVEIVNAEQPLPTPEPGVKPAEQGGAEIAAVQRAGGGGGEAGPVTLASTHHSLGELCLEMEGKPQRRCRSPGGRWHGETAPGADQP